MLKEFYDAALTSIAERDGKKIEKVTAAELRDYLVQYFAADPVVGFSAADGELYQQSGKALPVPVGTTGFVMDDFYIPITGGGR